MNTKSTFDPTSTDKCIVKGCTNHKNEGGFIGDICSPCYEMITSGVVKPTNSFIGDLERQVRVTQEMFNAGALREIELKDQLDKAHLYANGLHAINHSYIFECENLRKENKELQKTIECIEGEVAEVYCHITDHKISKANTKACHVISEADESYEKLYEEQIDALEARNEELERKLGYRKGFATVNPYRARINDLEKALKQCCNALWLASYASCTCLTKTPDSKYHADNCWYRTIREAFDAAKKLLGK